MGLGFLVDQIYLVSSGNYDPHAKKSEVFLGFLFTELYWTALQNRMSFSIKFYSTFSYSGL